jgi:biopolymer transport protein ExbD
MRRFSQRNSLVTLNEINITPLLDLAFVLLIIFIITRPLMEQSMEMRLPEVGHTAPSRIDQRDIRTVEISASGQMRLGGVPMNLKGIEAKLKADYAQNKNLVVSIRADTDSAWGKGVQVMHICLQNGITRIAPQTAPEK